MKTFKSNKEVTATPMTSGDYNKYRGWYSPGDNDNDDEGYLIEYLDGENPNHKDHAGYITWQTKEQFDNGYTEVVEGDYMSRLLDEQKDLGDKLNKLLDFTAKEKPSFIKQDEWARLLNQREVMLEYIGILCTRVEAAKELKCIETKFSFGIAVKLMKEGKKVARAGWNGGGMFAYYVPAAKYKPQTSVIMDMAQEDGLIPYRHYLALKTAQGDIATWAPSTSDALADDWVIVE